MEILPGAEKILSLKLPQIFSDTLPRLVFPDGLVYICRENGILICLDAKTGEEIYQESVYRNRHRGSPVIADGRIYLSGARRHGGERDKADGNIRPKIKMDERLLCTLCFCGKQYTFLREPAKRF
ncbi:MAG: hypothetical protein R3C26_07915 [Calditrichia bacterium]